jgi:predicted metal-binding protein
MEASLMSILEFARQLGIETCLEFSPELLVPEQRIRELCSENKCGNYRSNYMCPPHVGSLEEIKARLSEFRRGLLLQYSKTLDVRNDMEGVKETKIDFHNNILRLEEFLGSEGIQPVWGMIGGSCELCEPCRAKFGEPCPYPDKARMSLESIAIDVLSFLDRFGLDNKFYPDKITWTGCILF